MRIVLLLFAACILLSFSYKKKSDPDTLPEPDPPVATFFAKGADISWVTQMENEGVKFYDNTDKEKDLFVILKDLGMNTIRLRVWVNPANGWCGTADVLEKAKRARDAGFKIMINFHYSDSWADPGQQNKPAAWKDQNMNQLKVSVYNHTESVLKLLKQNNISPDWVQVGNETNDGMLWPEGKASVNMANFSLLINSGYDAVKSVFPEAKVIVHISNGYDNSLFRWMFDGLKTNGARYDVIGMSLYPSATNWAQLNSQCLENMKDMINRYNKEVMVCEIGMPMSDSAEAKKFITDLISKTKSIGNHKGTGVLYWEPQCYNNHYGYGLGAFNTSGQPTTALDAFK